MRLLWISHSTKKKKDWSKKTTQDYKSKIKYLKEAAQTENILDKRITELKRAHYRLLLETVKSGRKLTAAGYNIYREYLSSLLSELVQWDVLEYNPVKAIQTKDEIKTMAHRPPTKEEQSIIIRRVMATSCPYYRFLAVLYGCTIHPKEICALKIASLKKAAQVFRLVPEERSQYEHSNTKTRIEREVAIPDWVMKLLDEMNLQKYPGHCKYQLSHLLLRT